MREPDNRLFQELGADPATAVRGPRTMTQIGDCLAPSTIAAAVYDGHRYARELDEPALPEIRFQRERTMLA